jgi:glyoxylase-like metal-dependent hydrolase (beta-lactamase superfamily II)
VAAQEATPAAITPRSAQRLSVGEIDVIVLDDGVFAGPTSLLAVNAPDITLAETLATEGLSVMDTVPLDIHPLLIETSGQHVLLDTGSGLSVPGSGKLLAALDAEGIAPQEIDVVLLTHFHIDHYGGALDANGAHAFPNARYLINAVEYEFWAGEPTLDELVLPDDFKALFRQSSRDALAALQGTLELIGPGDEIAPGVKTVDARGHTPGQLGVEIASAGEGLIHIVDAAHLPAFHLQHPEWFMAADNWPAWTVTTRKALFDRAAAENLLVSTYHFPFPGVGHVSKDEIGWIWTPVAG